MGTATGCFVRTEDELVATIHAMARKKTKPDKVQVLGLDMVPVLLGSIPDKTTFVQRFLAIIYSVRGEDIRDAIRSSFMSWAVGEAGTESLEEKLVEVMGYSRPTKRIRALSDVFNAKDGQKARRAIKIIIEMVARNENIKKPRAIKYDAIAATHSIAQYDLKFMAYMARRNGKLLTNVWSEVLHRQAHDERYEKFLEVEPPEDSESPEAAPEPTPQPETPPPF